MNFALNADGWAGGRNRRAEWVIGGLATCVAIFLHVDFVAHAGGLWRDEAGLVGLSTLPSFRDVWRMLAHDHCPILMPALIRGWCHADWGATDIGLRVLGLIAGLLLPAAFWAASLIHRRGTPLLPLGLVVLNAEVIRTTDSLRAYGLGSALAVLLLPLIWRLAQKPSPGNAALAAVTAVGSVQGLYQNAFFVFAACCAGFVLCLRKRRGNGWLWILAVGIAAAASLVPYAPWLERAQAWWVLTKGGFSFSRAWQNISVVRVMGFPFPALNVVWLALCAAVIVVDALRGAGWHSPAEPQFADGVSGMTAGALARDSALFGATALVTGAAGFAVFLKCAQLPTNPWYYVPLLAFLAAGLDFSLCGGLRLSQLALAGSAALMSVAAALLGWPVLEWRQTDVDSIARYLNRESTADDFILVHPWYCGISLARYYHGAARWTTLPPLDDYRLFRYDLLKAKMQTADPIGPALENAVRALQSGKRVWLVWGMPPDGRPPWPIRPAPDNPWGWFEVPYTSNWGAQASYFLALHATRSELVIPPPSGVNPLENFRLVLVTGWRQSSGSESSKR